MKILTFWGSKKHSMKFCVLFLLKWATTTKKTSPVTLLTDWSVSYSFLLSNTECIIYLHSKGARHNFEPIHKNHHYKLNTIQYDQPFSIYYFPFDTDTLWRQKKNIMTPPPKKNNIIIKKRKHWWVYNEFAINWIELYICIPFRMVSVNMWSPTFEWWFFFNMT